MTITGGQPTGSADIGSAATSSTVPATPTTRTRAPGAAVPPAASRAA